MAAQPRTPPTEIWADHRLAIRRSPIEGRGWFAAERIEAGTTVLRLAGRLVSEAELHELIAEANADPGARYVDTFTVYDDAHLVIPPGTIAHFGNHSCEPSLWLTGPYELATRRGVEPAEELTVDYATFSDAAGFEMSCHCGSPRCRGRVTSEDWRIPELQARYEGHWAPALQHRIKAERMRYDDGGRMPR